MSAFLVKITVPGAPPLTRTTIATDSASMVMAAQDEFGPCRVSVKPA